MKWISVAAVCLVLSACNGRDSEKYAAQSSPQPQTFLGLKIGASNDLPTCSRYTDDGDYKVASLQEVTPCLTRDASQVIAVDGVPVQQSHDQVERVGVLFGTSQVPAGMRTTADATLQGEHLAQIRLTATESVSPAQEQAIVRMLREKFGAPRQDPTSAALIWSLQEMTIFSHPAERGNPAEVTATSNTFLRAIQQQHQRDSATSF